MNEFEKFVNDIPSEDKQVKTDFFGNQEQIEIPEKEQKGDDDVRKNRRHRRLEEQLQKERESNIALNERIKTLAEVAASNRSSTSEEIPSEWKALYGDTPESKTAWALQSSMFNNVKEQAKREALEEFDSKQSKAVQEQKQFESLIDSELEELEDEHNIDLTSDAPAARKNRREFLELVHKVSPKDDSGNITDYADFGSTFELYKSMKTEKNPAMDRQKELAGRSMQESGNGTGTEQRQTKGFFGWKTDNNL